MKRWTRNALIASLLILGLMTAYFFENLANTGGAEGPSRIVGVITSLWMNLLNLAAGAGYVGFFLLMLLASAFPVPSEVILPLAGYLVFQGILQYWPLVLYSTIAALLGSFFDYYIGLKLATQLLTGQTKLPYVSAEHLRRNQAWFAAYGPAAVALFRLIPTARVLISFPAGASRMSPHKFALFTLLGCLPWNIALVFVGWWLGSSWEEVTSFFRYINLLAVLVMILVVCWILWRLAITKRK